MQERGKKKYKKKNKKKREREREREEKMEFLTDCDGGRESPAEFSGELRSVRWRKRCHLHFAF